MHPRLFLAVLLTACAGRHETRAARGATVDDFGDTVPSNLPAQRIVSLNPTTTELLFALGDSTRLVGRTHWDNHPSIPDIGDALRPNVEAVLAVHPDLVLLYASADNRSAARRLRDNHIATLSIRVDRIEDFGREARLLGRILGDSARAATIVDTVQRTLDRVRTATASLPHPTVFWELWQSPLMAVGGGSFLNELLTIAGGTNIYGTLSAPSPVVSREDVLSRHPDVIFTSPRAAHDWQGRVLVPDTALIGQPSVRLGEAAVSLANLLHPGAVQ
ncbi:MAG TPA: helical backbone metal receptor [Gemmatimonadaceae bacterium]|nr:helical backbone metal receptor [Gemmatimonadaceae bacterium]